MLIRGYLLALLLCAVLPHHALALSCMPVEGDKVVNEIDRSESPLWFGQAKLISVYIQAPAHQNADLIAVYEIENTYLNTADDEIAPRVYVEVPGIHRTWGIWTSETFETGMSGQYAFRLNPDGAWVFHGPGMCTYFSDKEWDGLKSGQYKDHNKNTNKDSINAD